jgi:hypothetical protein
MGPAGFVFINPVRLILPLKTDVDVGMSTSLTGDFFLFPLRDQNTIAAGAVDVPSRQSENLNQIVSEEGEVSQAFFSSGHATALRIVRSMGQILRGLLPFY